MLYIKAKDLWNDPYAELDKRQRADCVAEIDRIQSEQKEDTVLFAEMTSLERPWGRR